MQQLQQRLALAPTPAPTPSHWDGQLQAALDAGLISGFALLTVNGVCQPVTGPLTAALGTQDVLPEDVLRCVRSFSGTDDGPDAIDLLGTRLQVVHRSSSSWYALGPRRALGLAAVQLPLGVLLLTFGRSTPLSVAVSTAEAAARRLRA